MAINQKITSIKILRQPNSSVIHRAITMWMVLTEYVTNKAGRFLIWFIRSHASFLHGVQDTAMNRFQSVTNVRQSTHNDYRHSVIDVGSLHFLVDLNGLDITMAPGLFFHSVTSFISSDNKIQPILYHL